MQAQFIVLLLLSQRRDNKKKRKSIEKRVGELDNMEYYDMK